MPVVRIDVLRSRPEVEVAAIIEAVYLAQREALKVPEGDRNIVYTEHQPARFAVPPGRSQDYTRIEFTLFPGRSAQAKRSLIEETTRGLSEHGIAPEDVLIVIHEPPLENWGLAGRSAAEIDLGFAVDV